MPTKRKRIHEASTSKKRLKQDDRIELGDPDVWEVDEILGEDARRYKISWAPNPTTGQVYSPTWEKKSNVNQEAIDDWEAKRKQHSSPSAHSRRRARTRKTTSVIPQDRSPTPTERERPARDNSLATPIPRASRRIIQSSPSLVTQSREVPDSPNSSESLRYLPVQSQLEDEVHSSSQPLPTVHDRPFEIAIPQIPHTQLDQYSNHGDSSHFSSSQIIIGTAPEREEQASPHHSTSTPLVDAAAVPDLTQRHSQYEQPNTSASAGNTTTSAEISTSEIRPDHEVDFVQSAIEDIEDVDESASYIAPTQTDTKDSNSSSLLDCVGVPLDFLVEEISDASASSPRDFINRAGSKSSSASCAPGPSPSSSPAVGVEIPAESIEDATESLLNNAEGFATHISESIEAQGLVADAHSLIIQETIPVSTGESHLESFDATQISQRPIRNPILRRRRPDPSSIDSAIFPEGETCGSQLVRLSSIHQPQVVPRNSRPDLQFFSQQQIRPQQSSRGSTGSTRSRRFQRTSQLGSPFRDSRADPISSAPQNSSSIHFQTQIYPQSQARPTLEGDTVDISSSSLHQPPAQWPETFHSAPPRPATPSASPTTPARTMSPKSPRSVPSETSTKIQELKDAGGPITPAQRSLGMTTRSANRAGSPALARDTRSPSAVPPAEVVPMPTAEENRTSGRYLTLVPEKPQDAKAKNKALPSGVVDELVRDTSHQLSEIAENRDITNMNGGMLGGSLNEFAVPIFFLGGQRDTYKQAIIWDRVLVDKFLAQAWPENSAMYDQARAFVTKLHDLESHPDLLNIETFTQAQTGPEDKAQWDKTTSAKFRFLYYLLAELAGKCCHIVIDVEQGRLLDVLANFLTGLQVDHITAGQQQSFSQQGGLKVTLLPKRVPSSDLLKADLVIGFEGCAILIEEGRRNLRISSSGSIAPLLYLVVPKTAEHVERYLNEPPYTSMSPSRRLSILIENAATLRNEAGVRQIQDQDSQNCAASIAKWLLDGQISADWPVDELPDLTLRDPTSESQATTASESTLQVPASSGSKRSLEDTSPPSAKKARIDDSPSTTRHDIPSTIDPSALSLSAITESNHAVATSEYLSDLAKLRADHEVIETILRNETLSLTKRLNEHIIALEELQYRHEDLRTELIKTRAERDEAYTTAATAASQLSSRDSIISKVKAERDTYKLQAEEAKAALHNHMVPETAELEKLKTRVEQADRDKLRLEGRVEAARKEAEYVRSLYQNASSQAANMAEEKAEMEARVGELERRATSAAEQARATSKDAAGRKLRLEVKRLRLEVADRERVLKGKDEEITRLKEKERGRMSTRGGSVPRSPGRLGSPMRLEPPRSSGVGSRAGSPRRGSPAAGTLGSGKSRLGRG